MNKEEISKITKYIFLESDNESADLAMVFGTRHKDAVHAAYDLYSNGFVNKILVSGGINKITKKNEAEEMKNGLVTLGVKMDDIIMENKSTNSLENVLFSKRIIEERVGFSKIGSIIAVVKNYHSRRAMMTLKKHFPKGVKLMPVVYDIYGFTRNDWMKSEVGREKVMSEWSKIAKYLKKGDIEEL